VAKKFGFAQELLWLKQKFLNQDLQKVDLEEE